MVTRTDPPGDLGLVDAGRQQVHDDDTAFDGLEGPWVLTRHARHQTVDGTRVDQREDSHDHVR